MFNMSKSYEVKDVIKAVDIESLLSDEQVKTFNDLVAKLEETYDKIMAEGEEKC